MTAISYGAEARKHSRRLYKGPQCSPNLMRAYPDEEGEFEEDYADVYEMQIDESYFNNYYEDEETQNMTRQCRHMQLRGTKTRSKHEYENVKLWSKALQTAPLNERKACLMAPQGLCPQIHMEHA